MPVFYNPPVVESILIGSTVNRGRVNLNLQPEIARYVPLDPATLPASICKVLLYAREDQMDIVEPVPGEKRIREWYDQSANALVLRQGTAGQRPRFFNAGSPGFTSPFFSDWVQFNVVTTGTNFMETFEDDFVTPKYVDGLTASMAFLVGINKYNSFTANAAQGVCSFEDPAIDTGSASTGSPFALMALPSTTNGAALGIRYFGGYQTALTHGLYATGNALTYAGYAGLRQLQGQNLGEAPPYFIGKNRNTPLGSILATSTGGNSLVVAGAATIPPSPVATYSRPFCIGRGRLTNTVNNFLTANLVYCCALNFGGVDITPYTFGNNDPTILVDRVNTFLLNNTGTFGQYFNPF